MPSLHEGPYSEIVRRIFLSRDAQDHQIVALTSTQPGGSVSFLCANLACVLGELHGRALVLNETHLVTAANELQVRDANFDKVEDGEIWVAPREQSKVPIRDVKAGLSLNGLLLLKQEFDFIVVDAGLPQRGFPSRELVSMVDGFVLVVTEGKTEFGEIARIRQKLTKAGARIIGVIYSGPFEAVGREK